MQNSGNTNAQNVQGVSDMKNGKCKKHDYVFKNAYGVTDGEMETYKCLNCGKKKKTFLPNFKGG